MMIYNKEPMEVLWDIVKSIATTIKPYKHVMNEEENDIPDSYILLTEANGAGDGTRVFGDGNTKIRKSDCQINLISKGAHQNSTDIHNINKSLIKGLLSDIKYDYIDLGFNGSVTETVYSLTINYVE